MSQGEIAQLLWRCAAGGDDAAWREAREHGCSEGLWLELAERRADSHPADSVKIYRDHVSDLLRHTGNRVYDEAVEYLEKILTLLKEAGEEAEFHILVGEIRSTQKRKRNLMKIFEAKGW